MNGKFSGNVQTFVFYSNSERFFIRKEQLEIKELCILWLNQRETMIFGMDMCAVNCILPYPNVDFIFVSLGFSYDFEAEVWVQLCVA